MKELELKIINQKIKKLIDQVKNLDYRLSKLEDKNKLLEDILKRKKDLK